MSEEDRRRNGTPDCDLENECELALVRELMRAIETYNKNKDIDICPLRLRDTMLAVAALLHLEAARISSNSTNKRSLRPKNHGNALAKAARDALEKVTLAKAALVASRVKN